MIPHTFYIPRDLENAVQALCLRRSVLNRKDLGEPSGDTDIIKINGILRLFHLGKPGVVTGKNHIKPLQHIFSCKAPSDC